MIWKFLVASFIIGSACAMHLEYLKVDSAEELFDETLDSVDSNEDLPMPEGQLPGMCWACKWAMKKLKADISGKANADMVKAKVSKVCNSIGFLRSLCRRMINKYTDVLVEELSTTDDPETICSNIGICKNYKSMGILEFIQASAPNYKKI